jgi:peroxiredoxin
MKISFVTGFILALCLVSAAAPVQAAASAQKKVSKKSVTSKTRAAKTEKTQAAAAKWGSAPDFTLQSTDGKKFTLSTLAGKVIVLNFWATWCPYCRTEIPDLMKLSDDYKNRGLVVVGVAFEQNPKGLGEFVKNKGINYAILIGNREVMGKFPDVTGIPTTFIIDRNGNIVKKLVGAVKKEALEDEITKHL